MSIQIKTFIANSGNYQTESSRKIEFIAIHYTANDGDTAMGNASYFRNNVVKVSAHYFVDPNEIVQSVRDKDSAYSVGIVYSTNGDAAKFRNVCKNHNSLSIEMCSIIQKGKFVIPEKTQRNAAKLTAQLMKKYGISIDNVLRHYDVCGKVCPEPFVRDINQWKRFKNMILEEVQIVEEVEALKRQVEALQKTVDSLAENTETRWNWIDANLPEWAVSTVDKLYRKKILSGYADGLHLNLLMLRILVILDRAGVFGK